MRCVYLDKITVFNKPLLEISKEHMPTNSVTALQEQADYSKEICHWMSLLPQQHSFQQGMLVLTQPVRITRAHTS